MQITYTKTEANAFTPLDLRTHIELYACNFEERDVIIPPRGAASIQTGITLQLPAGVIGQLFSLRGNGEACRLATGAALITDDLDSPLELRMHNDTDLPFTVVHGESLAHLVPIRITDFVLAELAAAPAGQAAAPAPAAKKSAKKASAKPATEAAPAETATETAEAAPAADGAEPAPGADALATDKPAE